MESSGTCCTGPVGPEGNGGCSTFFTFFWLWAVAARTGFPGHRKATPKNAVHTILLSFDPVLITSTPHRARTKLLWGDFARLAVYKFYHRAGSRWDFIPPIERVPCGFLHLCLDPPAAPRDNRIGSQPFRSR